MLTSVLIKVTFLQENKISSHYKSAEFCSKGCRSLTSASRYLTMAFCLPCGLKPPHIFYPPLFILACFPKMSAIMIKTVTKTKQFLNFYNYTLKCHQRDCHSELLLVLVVNIEVKGEHTVIHFTSA